jgi:hypothetical protein
MFEWILNPFGVDVGAYVVLRLGLLVILIGSVIAVVITMVFG